MVGFNSTVYFIGVDPGKQGGIVIIDVADPKRDRVIYEPMPPSELDLWNFLKPYAGSASIACLEAVSSRPGEGVVAVFTFGQGYGRLKMALTAAKIRYDTVRPQDWMKTLGITSRAKTESKPQFKERLRVRAQTLYPDLPIWSEPRSLGRQRAICDALLLAEFCRRRYGVQTSA